jgi:2-oxoglutarate dehydrogenase E2 component (dihydrolipoamide succinyltransferase)
VPSPDEAVDEVERRPMSRLRRRIAERLVEAQRTAAILTTFNEVDLSQLLDGRRRNRERFRERHGVDLGLVSLFGRACILALADVPIVNARIDGDDVVYHRHVHLGIAVSTPRGLVVPVVRHAERLRLAELETAIAERARRARDAKLTPDDLAGGPFTISNGGVFGSLLSTPILNPPQSGILGMHKIEERPVARDGQVVIRPMMYVALSYDHRLVDGEQAVTFLVRVKDRLEDPVRMLLEV